MFPCERCGADLRFQIGQERMHCPHCGYEKPLELDPAAEIVEQDLDAMLARMRELHDSGRDTDSGQCEVRCDACGATVVFIGTLTSSECPYCTTPIQRDRIHTAADRIAVDGVLPFFITEQAAQKNLAEWVNSRWFAPNAFRKRGVRGKFHGVYLPFFTFDAMTFTRYTGQRGEHYYVTVGAGKNKTRQRRTRWYPASGSFQRFFDDVLVRAAGGLNADLLHGLEPWPMQRCIPFTQEVLTGLMARTYDIELDQCFSEAKDRIATELAQDVRRRIGGDEQRVSSIDTAYAALTFKHLLLPVWLLAYRYHDQTYQVTINAANGQVQGERPWSWLKITFAVLGAVLAVAILVLLFRG